VAATLVLAPAAPVRHARITPILLVALANRLPRITRIRRRWGRPFLGLTGTGMLIVHLSPQIASSQAIVSTARKTQAA
jgi:hypothetical protein